MTYYGEPDDWMMSMSEHANSLMCEYCGRRRGEHTAIDQRYCVSRLVIAGVCEGFMFRGVTAPCPYEEREKYDERTIRRKA